MHNHYTEKASFTCQEVKISLTSIGIILVSFRDNAEVSKDTIKWILKKSHELTNKKVPFIYVGGEFVTLTKDASQHQKETHHLMPFKAKAVVVNNLAQKLLADFHYRLQSTEYPLKIFRNEEDAVEWAKSFVNKDEVNCA